MRFFLLLIAVAAYAHSPKSEPPRMADGHPDLQGVWRNASISAAFNVEGQTTGDNGPGGKSVISDPPNGKLPYLPAAREKADDNAKHRERDPVGHCHMHGVPRTMVPPFPLNIEQDSEYLLILFDTERCVQIIPLDGRAQLKNYRPWAGD